MKPEPLHCVVVEGAVAGCGPVRWWKESGAFVVADRVGRQTNATSELRDGEGHAVRVNVGVDSNVNKPMLSPYSVPRQDTDTRGYNISMHARTHTRNPGTRLATKKA